ncbi:MAG: peptidoglycan DD-metalloendopeptidase family protein [Alphaproteobacteria bacterium]|nr:peptidoglycan DD-metalloendopeptidase family protein [Alphaproteobacteria bacterium]
MAMLADANHLAPPYRIRVGQALIAPTAGASSPSGPVVAMAEPTSPPPPGPALQPMTAPPVPPAPVSVQPLPPERSAPVSTQPLAQPLDHTSPAQVAKPPPTTPPLPLTPPAPALSKANPAQAAAPTGPTKPSANAPAGSATSGAIESKSGAMASAPIPPLAAPGASKPPSGSTAAPGPMAAAEPPPAASHGGSFLWPVRGHVVEGFGTGPEGTHNDGINIAAPRGAAIEATDGGVVAYTGNELRGYGNLILIKHPQGWISAYAHCDLILVKPGQKVARGQVIARVGSTGNVSEPQLHFELRRGKKPVDPREYLVPLSTAASKDGHSS